MTKLFFAGCLLLGASALAEPNISVNINGTKYLCSESACNFSCEGRLSRPILCNGVMVTTGNRTGSILLLEKKDGQIVSCLSAIQEATDFDALVKCNQMRRQICD